MKLELPSKTKTLLEIRAFILFALVLAIPIYLAIVFSPWIYIAAAVLFCLYIIVAFVYIPLFIKSMQIFVYKEGVTVKYGVIYKFEQIMPTLRLIFIETHQTPLARAMGLCAVSFLGAKSRITVPEINVADAKRIALFVKRNGKCEENGE